MTAAPRVSIIVPTRNRLDLLRDCVGAISASALSHEAELIIIDDGSQPPLVAESLRAAMSSTVLRLEGGGPAAARNAGARTACGEVLLFTDDDTIPSPTWVSAALGYLDGAPSAVGVTGPIRSTAWDPLYEQSVEAGAAGHYWTCNIAYRRGVFETIGGFRADVFTHAHAEDRDLAIRALERGDIGFAAQMEVSHTPRRIAVRDVVRQARWARDDLTLYALHPELTADFALPPRLALVVGAGRTWLQSGFHGQSLPSLRRVTRSMALGAVAAAATAWAVLRTPSAGTLRARYALSALQP